MARRIYIISSTKEIDASVIAAAKAANCPEIAVGIPPRLSSIVTDNMLPYAYEEPSPVLTPTESLHVAALMSVYLSPDGYPRANVTRKYMGQNFSITNCRVSLIAYEHYQAGKIKLFNNAYPFTDPNNADCFVLVYFISETPFDDTMDIPVIIDKVNR